MNWSDVLERKTQPPFLPLLKSPDDVSNFDDEFTSKPAIDSPPGIKISYLVSDLNLSLCSGPAPSPSVDDVFLGFSYDGDTELRDAD